jgi:hypothetical protein
MTLKDSDDNRDDTNRSERVQTDESLKTERAKTDGEFARRRAAIEEDTDDVIETARDRADNIIEAARTREDRKLPIELRHNNPAADDIQRERASEDMAVSVARSAADLAILTEA